MGCKWYLAMTGAELAGYAGKDAVAWMACRFSGVHDGLGNLPERSPELLILDDLIPFENHDPRRIAEELTAHPTEGILLDFQRDWDSAPVIQAIIKAASCPVGITEKHAGGWDCAVLISPPLNLPLSKVIRKDRECWLDVAVGMQEFTVTEQGCAVSELKLPFGEFTQQDEKSHCRYRVERSPEQIRYSLCRQPQALGTILADAGAAGFTKAIGLYQDFAQKI